MASDREMARERCPVCEGRGRTCYREGCDAPGCYCPECTRVTALLARVREDSEKAWKLAHRKVNICTGCGCVLFYGGGSGGCANGCTDPILRSDSVLNEHRREVARVGEEFVGSLLRSGVCPACGGNYEHHPDCWLAAAIRREP